MRVAIIQTNGYLDRQLQRLTSQHNINGDIVQHITRNVVETYDCMILSYKNDIQNLPIVIERIILEKKITVIYVSNNPNVGYFYNVYNDLRFHMINEVTMEVELPVTLKLLSKYMTEINHLQKKSDDFKERYETLQLTNKAKRILMNKGLSEEESHQFIQRKSMDMRVSKRRLVNLIIENKVDI